jgi:hypothetical protein
VSLRLPSKSIGSLFSLVLLAGFSYGSPSLAQKEKPSGITIKPATGKELFVYFGIGATSMCGLLVQDVPFKSALSANAESIAGVIIGLHGGQVENGPKLGEKEALNFSVNNLVLRTSEICPTKLPQEVQEKLKKINAQGENKSKP